MTRARWFAAELTMATGALASVHDGPAAVLGAVVGTVPVGLPAAPEPACCLVAGVDRAPS